MVQLTELFDSDELEQEIAGRYVRSQTHPSLPLEILNYTELAQFQHHWNDVTLNCRGLIWNFETGEVVARGFKKFFNWDDSSQPYPPKGPVLRSPKMDGSLGIMYKAEQAGREDSLRIATRGSFESDQAIHATAKLWQMFMNGEADWHEFRDDRTYLFEIIYPENRIVVNYHGDDRLVLLDVLDTATGKADLDEFDRVYWLDKVRRKYLPGGFSDQFTHEIPEGEEGFVVYWPECDYRVKMKAAAYLELHRMIFSLSERSVWARMGEGETIGEICEQLPDEFHAWVKSVGERLLDDEERIISQVKKEFNSIVRDMKLDATRKEFAAKAGNSPNRAWLFMLYDGKDIADSVWASLKPEGGKSVTTISEDVA